jgi:2-oxoisovalerate dehydrogenase E1 component
MNGRRVFNEGVKRMSSALNQICQAYGIDLEDIDLVVPHQANQRIINAIGNRLGSLDKVASNLRFHGNTSSSSIPIFLSEHWDTIQGLRTVAVTAFGGGFTYGAAILTRL